METGDILSGTKDDFSGEPEKEVVFLERSRLTSLEFPNSGNFWSSTEVSARTALKRNINSDNSTWNENNRYNGNVPLCVGDEICFLVRI